MILLIPEIKALTIDLKVLTIPSVIPLKICPPLANKFVIHFHVVDAVVFTLSHIPVKKLAIGLTTFLLNHDEAAFQVVLILSQTLAATAFTVSQFLTNKIIPATSAAIATITNPIGDVKNATAAPKAVVTVVATAQTEFQATVAAVIAT